MDEYCQMNCNIKRFSSSLKTRHSVGNQTSYGNGGGDCHRFRYSLIGQLGKSILREKLPMQAVTLLIKRSLSQTTVYMKDSAD